MLLSYKQGSKDVTQQLLNEPFVETGPMELVINPTAHMGTKIHDDHVHHVYLI